MIACIVNARLVPVSPSATGNTFILFSSFFCLITSRAPAKKAAYSFSLLIILNSHSFAPPKWLIAKNVIIEVKPHSIVPQIISITVIKIGQSFKVARFVMSYVA